jgi:hypothetical protein
VTASGAELGAHPVKAAEIATAAVSVALSQTESAKDLNTTEDKGRLGWRPRQSHLRIHQKRKMSATGIPPNSPIAQAVACI